MASKNYKTLNLYFIKYFPLFPILLNLFGHFFCFACNTIDKLHNSVRFTISCLDTNQHILVHAKRFSVNAKQISVYAKYFSVYAQRNIVHAKRFGVHANSNSVHAKATSVNKHSVGVYAKNICDYAVISLCNQLIFLIK